MRTLAAHLRPWPRTGLLAGPICASKSTTVSKRGPRVRFWNAVTKERNPPCSRAMVFPRESRSAIVMTSLGLSHPFDDGRHPEPDRSDSYADALDLGRAPPMADASVGPCMVMWAAVLRTLREERRAVERSAHGLGGPQ